MGLLAQPIRNRSELSLSPIKQNALSECESKGLPARHLVGHFLLSASLMVISPVVYRELITGSPALIEVMLTEDQLDPSDQPTG